MGSAASSSWKESWGRRAGSTIPSAGSKPEGHAGFHAAWVGGGAVCRIGAPGRWGGARDPLLHLLTWILDKCTSLRSQFPRSVNGAGDTGHEEMPTAGRPAARWPWSSATWPCSPQHRVPAMPLRFRTETCAAAVMTGSHCAPSLLPHPTLTGVRLSCSRQSQNRDRAPRR